MGDSMELDAINIDGHGDAEPSEVRVAVDSEAAVRNGVTPERETLLSEQTSSSNGAPLLSHSNQATGNQNGGAPQKRSAACKIADELNKVVCGTFVKLWMVLVGLILLVILVIILSLFLCSVFYEDPDENFDPSLFNVSLHLNGSFRLPNMVFTEELSSFSSNESKVLAKHLKKKLTDLYGSSPALGRYFSAAEILAFSNGSVIADYKLTFVMPEEEQDLLRNFTLSREMVFNVFRQFLHEQGLQESEPKYIELRSLRMFSSG